MILLVMCVWIKRVLLYLVVSGYFLVLLCRYYVHIQYSCWSTEHSVSVSVLIITMLVSIYNPLKRNYILLCFNQLTWLTERHTVDLQYMLTLNCVIQKLTTCDFLCYFQVSVSTEVLLKQKSHCIAFVFFWKMKVEKWKQAFAVCAKFV